jgi:TadE-like protein
MIRARRGAAYVEFLIVILPFLTLILCIIQAAQLYVGRLTVERAAEAAARAAIVVLDDDPRCYGGAARNTIAGGGSRQADPIAKYLSAIGAPAASGSSGGARLADIRDAASMVLLSISPPFSNGSVLETIGANKGAADATGAADYNQNALQVSFANGDSVGLTDEVTVRLEYKYHCGVPLVRYFLCRGDGPARYFAMRAETTLPNQGANYEYRGRGMCHTAGDDFDTTINPAALGGWLGFP